LPLLVIAGAKPVQAISDRPGVARQRALVPRQVRGQRREREAASPTSRVGEGEGREGVDRGRESHHRRHGLTHGITPDTIWYIPLGIDQKEVMMMEVLFGVALLAWTVLVLLTTGDEAV
jgi:hypothetical protein